MSQFAMSQQQAGVTYPSNEGRDELGAGVRQGNVSRTVVGALSLMLMFWVPVGAWAQSQEGGLPALAERVKTLENLVTSLSGALAAETAARQAADAALQS